MPKYLLIALFLLSFSASAEITKWKDEKGQWHFSDAKKTASIETSETSRSKPLSGSKAIAESDKGQLILKDSAHGQYYQYVGRCVGEQFRLVVINHGMFGKEKTETIAAKQMVEPWFDFASKHCVILVAPIFNNEAFSVTVDTSNYGGYRGLFGRDINADDFLDEIIADYQRMNRTYDGRFYLVGHSAGAQFSNRYMVRHPERVIAAAYSAPAWLSFPDPKLKWPLGMGPKVGVGHWKGRTIGRVIDIHPSANWWVKAAQVPTALVVGDRDLTVIRHVEGVGGDNRVERAKFWVKSMHEFAALNGVQSKQQFLLVPGIGHRYDKLVPTLQEAIAKFMAKG